MRTLAAILAFLLPTFAHAADVWGHHDKASIEVREAFKRSDNWTRQERIAFTLSVVAHAADLYTSLNSNHDPSKGPYCRETNPLLGDNPSPGALVAAKLVAIGIEYWVYSSPRIDSRYTHFWGYTSFVIHGYAAYSNSRNDCYGVG
jgi:hypothetical protein